MTQHILDCVVVHDPDREGAMLVVDRTLPEISGYDVEDDSLRLVSVDGTAYVVESNETLAKAAEDGRLGALVLARFDPVTDTLVSQDVVHRTAPAPGLGG